MREWGQKEEISIFFDRNINSGKLIGMFLTISGSREMPQKGTKKSSHKKHKKRKRERVQSSSFSLPAWSPRPQPKG
jgi:hypothetical protein